MSASPPVPDSFSPTFKSFIECSTRLSESERCSAADLLVRRTAVASPGSTVDPCRWCVLCSVVISYWPGWATLTQQTLFRARPSSRSLHFLHWFNCGGGLPTKQTHPFVSSHTDQKANCDVITKWMSTVDLIDLRTTPAVHRFTSPGDGTPVTPPVAASVGPIRTPETPVGSRTPEVPRSKRSQTPENTSRPSGTGSRRLAVQTATAGRGSKPKG